MPSGPGGKNDNLWFSVNFQATVEIFKKIRKQIMASIGDLCGEISNKSKKGYNMVLKGRFGLGKLLSSVLKCCSG